MTSIYIHDVAAIKLRVINYEVDTIWRELRVETTKGHAFTITLLAKDVDNLKLDLQEAGD